MSFLSKRSDQAGHVYHSVGKGMPPYTLYGWFEDIPTFSAKIIQPL